MYHLAYGKVEIVGSNQGVQFSRCKQFGQWPLYVNGNKHIHESLEASNAYQAAIDNGEVNRKGQERWTGGTACRSSWTGSCSTALHSPIRSLPWSSPGQVWRLEVEEGE